MKQVNIKTISKLVKILISEGVISEIGDLRNIKPYDYDIFDASHAYFKTDSEDKVVMSILRLNKYDCEDIKKQLPKTFKTDNEHCYNIGYEVNDTDTQSKIPNYKDLIKILSTIFKAANEIIEKYFSDKKHIFIIGAMAKIGFPIDDNQKLALYKTIIAQHISKDYRTAEVKFETYTFITLQKIK